MSVLEMSPLVDGEGLRLAGELDLATAPKLAEALLDFASSEGELHLNLSGLTFLDSSGLHVILALADSRGDDRPVVLLNPHTLIMRTFEIAGIDEHPGVEIRHPSTDRAMA